MNATLKAVLFDMDDTLIDWSGRTIDWQEHERARLGGLYDYFTGEGHNLADREEFYASVRQFAQQDWQSAEESLLAPNYARAMAEALMAHGVPAERIDPDACIRAYGWGLIPGVKAFPDVPAALAELVANGVKVGLITNASVPMRFRDAELEAVDLLRYVSDCRFAAVDIGYLKPHPAVFEHALAHLGIAPAEAVFVGDNLQADVMGSMRVGLRGVLRRLAHRPVELGETDIVPSAVVDDFFELLAHLDAWYPGWRPAVQSGVADMEHGARGETV
jgi:putative hydrolase of the HAD superfamily